MPPVYSVSRALVTGAGRGIGAAIALRLAREGLDVAVVDLDEETARETSKRIGAATGREAVSRRCDVSNREEVAAVIASCAEELGGLDTLVTNAGIARDSFGHKMSDDAWDEVLAVQLTGTFVCYRAAAPYLRANGPGRMVTISSISAAMGNLGQANYTAAKGGILSLTKTLARELARSGTTVNCVRPGFIDTPMTAVLEKDARDHLLRKHPVAARGATRGRRRRGRIPV